MLQRSVHVNDLLTLYAKWQTWSYVTTVLTYHKLYKVLPLCICSGKYQVLFVQKPLLFWRSHRENGILKSTEIRLDNGSDASRFDKRA